LVRTLVLISPTGFNGKPRRYGPPGESLGVPWLYALLTKRLWAGALFKGLTRPGVIRYFLRRSWGSKQIDETQWQYDILTARQTGAQHAPLYFLSAFLFSRDINDLYERVLCSVWVSKATRGDFTDYQGRHTVEGRPNWQFHPIDRGSLALLRRSWCIYRTAGSLSRSPVTVGHLCTFEALLFQPHLNWSIFGKHHKVHVNVDIPVVCFLKLWISTFHTRRRVGLEPS
jgi:hypothetical protein